MRDPEVSFVCWKWLIPLRSIWLMTQILQVLMDHLLRARVKELHQVCLHYWILLNSRPRLTQTQRVTRFFSSESSIEIDQVSQWLVEHDVDSASEISSEELALWIEALEPCECCGLRTPFRCRNCGRVVCLDPTCRNRHSTVCGMSWKQWFWSLFGCFHFWRRG